MSRSESTVFIQLKYPSFCERSRNFVVVKINRQNMLFVGLSSRMYFEVKTFLSDLSFNFMFTLLAFNIGCRSIHFIYAIGFLRTAAVETYIYTSLLLLIVRAFCGILWLCNKNNFNWSIYIEWNCWYFFVSYSACGEHFTSLYYDLGTDQCFFNPSHWIFHWAYTRVFQLYT